MVNCYLWQNHSCHMPISILDDSIWFPQLAEAEPDGLLAVGGDLSMDRLLLAYQSGIFPWFNDDDPPLWWSPDPRFVLFPDKLHISKSMRQVIKHKEFEFRVNTAFEDVIHNCSAITRNGMDGTWITNEIVEAYTQLHQLGYAHSAEAWRDGALVGGLYGVKLGNIFFGESMFSKQSNASKFAFISWVEVLKSQGVRLIDCQVHTPHLESLGAEMIPREDFIKLLNDCIDG
ncbi:MAG: leucyl/phenylalanyl-tRNA--protein transferase, partial [Flavipsychrobacter sp.]|nr:leucyl/phenylalanyl-tRNA--protein transferase [Flavipsychrobacter sp.]